VDGVKVSLLDADLEVAIRRRLPAGVRLYTGDDFNFPGRGVTFLAWLSGYQDQFVMLGRQQAGRSVAHLATLFWLAGEAGLFPDPELAAERMRTLSHG
jgi:hypothetical protein